MENKKKKNDVWGCLLSHRDVVRMPSFLPGCSPLQRFRQTGSDRCLHVDLHPHARGRGEECRSRQSDIYPEGVYSPLGFAFVIAVRSLQHCFTKGYITNTLQMHKTISLLIRAFAFFAHSALLVGHYLVPVVPYMHVCTHILLLIIPKHTLVL